MCIRRQLIDHINFRFPLARATTSEDLDENIKGGIWIQYKINDENNLFILDTYLFCNIIELYGWLLKPQGAELLLFPEKV